MANEISLSSSLSVRNGNLQDNFNASKRVDQAAARSVGGVFTASATVATVSFGQVQTAGYASFRSLEAQTAGTHYVAIGHYDGTTLHEFARLKPNDVAGPIRLAKTITLGALAYTSSSYSAAQSVQFLVLED
jgi:hypothetical protein